MARWTLWQSRVSCSWASSMTVPAESFNSQRPPARRKCIRALGKGELDVMLADAHLDERVFAELVQVQGSRNTVHASPPCSILETAEAARKSNRPGRLRGEPRAAMKRT